MKKFCRHNGLLFISMLIAAHALAQDIQFTQFYAAPLYLNPAFAGANVCSRLTTNYRAQWPGIKKTYTSYTMSYDHSLPKISSGIGFLCTNDRAGSGNLRTTSFNALYSYEVLLTRSWAVRMGLQAGEIMRGIDFERLIFADQISRGNAPSTIEIPPDGKVLYFDMAGGLLIYSRRYWFGFAAHHLTHPNQALVSAMSLLPFKFSFHSGVNLPVGDPVDLRKSKTKSDNSKQYFSPAINYKAQEKFDQLDIGLYYNYKPMVLGIWYRGIPVFKTYNGNINHDAIAIVAGFETRSLKFGYSYDLTISSLASASGGAHEVSVGYQFCEYAQLKKTKKSPSKNFVIPCAKF